MYTFLFDLHFMKWIARISDSRQYMCAHRHSLVVLSLKFKEIWHIFALRIDSFWCGVVEVFFKHHLSCTCNAERRMGYGLSLHLYPTIENLLNELLTHELLWMNERKFERRINNFMPSAEKRETRMRKSNTLHSLFYRKLHCNMFFSSIFDTFVSL